MKKLITTSLLVAFCALAALPTMAQVLWSQNFESSGATIPTGWTQTTNATDGGWKFGTGNTSTSFAIPTHTNYASTNDDACNCTKNADVLVTDPIVLTGTAVYLSFDMYYYHGTYNGATESCDLKISTNGGTTWTTVQALPGITVNAWQTQIIDLSAYTGQTVMLSFTYNDGGGWLFGCALDNISVYNPAAYDLSVTAITTGDFYAIGTVPITGTIMNYGSTTITSLDLNYSITPGSGVTNTLSGLSIAPLTSYNFTATTPWNATTVGAFVVDAFATNLNGANADANPANDSKSKTVNILSENIQRVPLYEIFTSSTCGPCVAGNANFHSIVDPMPQDEFAAIKYQQDFPGTGDPYCTTEGVNRRNYYSINSIPRMEIDGGWDGNAQSFTNQMYNDEKALPAQYKLNGVWSRNSANKTITAKVRYAPLFAATGTKIYMAVIENKTTQNVKTNGETEFKQVMKKMLPTENGTAAVNHAVGVWDSLTLTYTVNGNYRLPADGAAANRINNATENSVEEFSDLRVLGWAQGSTKQVYQAANLVMDPNETGVYPMSAAINTINIYPNPSSSFVNVDLNMASAETATIKFMDMKGVMIETRTSQFAAGSNMIQFNTSNLASGNYLIGIIDAKGNAFVKQVTVAH